MFFNPIQLSKYLLICCAVLLTSNALAAVTANQQHTMLTLLMSENHKDFRTAAMMVGTEKTYDTEILDLMAERVMQGSTKQADAEQAKTTLYLARVFAKLGNARYRPVLQYCLGFYTDKGLQKEFEAALATTLVGNTPPYQPGSISLAALRAKLTQVADQNRQEFAGRQKLLPALGQRMNDVYADLGLPDAVLSLDIAYTRLGNIKAFYYGLGIVQFDYVGETSPVLQVVAVMPEPADVVGNYAGLNLQYAHALASADEKYFRYLVKGGWNLVETDPALVEVLYKKINTLAPSRNKYALDAIVYTLKQLSLLKPANYKPFLVQLTPKLDSKSVAKLARALQDRQLITSQ